MHISELLDVNKLQEEIDAGYVSCRRHNELPLKIYNYTASTQYDWHWNDVTLQCRGLIVNEAGTVIARPFRKIFNYHEIKDSLNTSGPVRVTDKLDGSLGICFLYGGEYHVATRGSFHSDQAEWATGFVRERPAYCQAIFQFQESGFTPLVEIIYPDNRIVIDYKGKEDLVLLWAMPYDYQNDEAVCQWSWPGEIAQVFEVNSFEEALSLPPRENAEGVVVYFKNTNEIVKIKQEDYVRLHKTIFSMSKKTIWQDLSNGLFVADIIENIPDELHDLLKGYVKEIESDFDTLLDDIVVEYEKIYNTTNGKTRKEWASAIKDHKYQVYFWLILDRNFSALEKAIFKSIRPKG